MLTCREVSERSNDYLDGRLGFWRGMEMRLHLLACRYCRAFVRQMQAAIRLVDGAGHALPDDEAPEAVMEAFRRKRLNGDEVGPDKAP